MAAKNTDQKSEWYISNFKLFEKSLNGDGASEVHSLRRAAIARFSELGFPTTHDEEWKYTDISRLAKVPFKSVLHFDPHSVSDQTIEQFLFGNRRWQRVVFLNGHHSSGFSSKSSSAQGVKIENLAAALKNDSNFVRDHLAHYALFNEDPFTALSTAFFKDGALVVIPHGLILEEPIHLLFVSDGNEDEFVTYPRNLIIAEKNSQATIIESYVSLKDNRYFTNAVTEIVLGENAVLEHEKIQLESESAYHVGTLHTSQSRNSSFVSNSISFGGSLVRNNIRIVLDGEGAECTLNGLYVGTEKRLIDNHTAIDHAKPNCTSHEVYKGILGGKSKGVFNGKIIVRKDAQKTDAKQTNKNLILSDDASIDTKPQLEIFANDVKCTHGATIGQLDDEAMFYLRSRGIGLEEAREMLIYAFASDVIERILPEPLRERLHGILHKRLGRSRN